ncbi:hypothetical protein RJ640_014490 [Escallonia rubra]|uniref:Pentatricopeptide repeat-containing protein n=1 Tax=Escallonia rubra TaxID=112253 RepID=A0AA88R0U1_9ASTE|nr:hypothetical protein RJ640_014490 [Escallonia rubra]
MNGSVWRATVLQKRRRKPPLLLVGRAYLMTYIDVRNVAESPVTTVKTYVRKSRLLQSLKQALHHPHSTNDDNNNTPLITLLSDPLLKDDPTVLAQALRSGPSADSAISLIETLDQHVPQFSHNRSSVHAFARVLAESGRAIDLHNLMEAAIADAIPGLELFSYSGDDDWYPTDQMEFARHYYALGDLDSLLEIWRLLVPGVDSKIPCTESFNMVMDLYGRNGNHSEAVKIFRALVKEKRIPNTRTYSIMIEHLASAGKFESAKQVFDILPRMRIKRTARQYSVLLGAFTEMKSFDVVRSLICEMQLDGILPGQSTRLALQSMMESGLMEEVDALVRQLLPDGTRGSLEDIDFGFTSSSSESEKDDDEDKSFESKPMRPLVDVDPRFFAKSFWNLNPETIFAMERVDFEWTTPLVCKVIRNLRQIDRAWNFFQWLEKSKPRGRFRHNVYTVSTMIAILAAAGRGDDRMDELLSKIKREGIKLPFFTVKLIIDFHKNNYYTVDPAIKILREIEQFCDPLPEFNMKILYCSLFRTLSWKRNSGSNVVVMLNEMIFQRGILPDIQTFTGLIYYFGRRYKDLKTVKYLSEMVGQCDLERDVHFFQILIRAYVWCRKPGDAYRVFEEMRKSNMMPDFTTRNVLCKGLKMENKLNEIAAIKSTLDNDAVLPLTWHGYIFKVSFADLSRIYDIYSSSFLTNQQPVRDRQS